MGKIVALSGPRGCGKSTVINHLASDYNIQRVVPYTTREPRANEHDGIDYHFVDDNYFERVATEQGMFDVLRLNSAKYGTPIPDIQHALSTHDAYTFNLAAASSLKLQQGFGRNAVRAVFMIPSNWRDIEDQMRAAGISEEELRRRIDNEPNDLQLLPQFDHIVVNQRGKLDNTVSELASYIGAIMQQ